MQPENFLQATGARKVDLAKFPIYGSWPLIYLLCIDWYHESWVIVVWKLKVFIKICILR